MPCLTDNDVIAWFDDALAPERRATVVAHVDDCAACLALIAAASRAAEPGAGEAALDPAGRYELLDELAAGGMGRIYLAHDRLLGREVALKLGRDPDRPELTARLRREMAIAARLQHPAIVPIYDAGTASSGEPFFVMPRAPGKPLDELIAARPRFEDRIALLPGLIGAIDAIGYAHSRGVLHRDLKPQNLLFGEHGEVAVIDWGLAIDREVMARRGPIELKASAMELSIAVTVADGGVATAANGALDALTAAGGAVGTLGYMPPEQLAGDALDERADVYCLGGVLYHLLSRAAPHAGSDGRRTDRPAALAARCPEVPGELAAIVGRALEVEPGARYPGAGALADDLRRFTSGRLVRAHDYSPGQLARRWLRRHRAKVVAAVVALAALGVVGALSLRRIIEARHDAQLARDVADLQRASAEELVAFTLTDLRRRLDRLGRLDLLAEVGTRVDAYYRAVPPRIGPAGQADLTRQSEAYGMLGEVARFSGRLDEALAMDRRALGLAQAALDRARSDGTIAGLCRAQQGLSRTLLERADLSGARDELSACIALADGAAAAVRDPMVAVALAQLSQIDRRQGNLIAAHDNLVRALPHAERAAATGDVTGRRALAFTLDALGTVAKLRGSPVDARGFARRGVAAVRGWLAATPDDADLQHDLAAVLGNLGLAEDEAGDPTAAVRAFEEARTIGARLNLRDPANVPWLRSTIFAIDGLGQVALAAGDLARAAPLLEESHQLSSRLADLNPTLDNRRDVAAGELMLGQIAGERGQQAEASRRAQAAATIMEALLAEAPGRADFEHDLGTVYLNLAVHVRTVDRARSREHALRSVAIRRAALAREATDQARLELAESLMMADAAGAPGAHDEARGLAGPLRAAAAPGTFAAEVMAAVFGAP